MELKDINELRKKKERAESEVKRLDKEISKLEAEKHDENVVRVIHLMNDLKVSIEHIQQRGKPVKAMTKRGKTIDAVFRDPRTQEPFAKRGSYGKRIQKLLDAGIPFEDIVIDKSMVESLKAQFELNKKKKSM
jgi:hypothetical protein